MRENIFRLAAILLNENSNSRQASIRKIINFNFFENGNNLVGAKRVQQRIIRDFELIFSIDEITEILEEDEYDSLGDKDEKQYKLKERNFERIKSEFTYNSIEIFAREYYELSDKIRNSYSFPDFSELIYTYLYDVYNGEKEKISSLFDIKKINSPDITFTNKEISIINDFLDWENHEKNKAVYGIVSLALEYCMVTSNTRSIHIDNIFKDKIFYLDTNVLVRLMGFNGDLKFKQVNFLIEKLFERKVKLKVGRNVYDEFEVFLSNKIKGVQKLINGGNLFNPIIIQNQIDEGIYGVYSEFFKWVKEAGTTNLDLFSANVIFTMKELLKKYNIEIDEEAILENFINSEAYGKNIETLCNAKNIEEDSNFFSIVETDVVSVMHVLKLRGGSRKSIQDEIYFLLSTDGYLINWRSMNSRDKVSLISKPSVWVNLIMRFDTRVNNSDYASFVNYIKKASKYENPLEIEKARIIVNKILEYANVIEDKVELMDIVVAKYSTEILNSKSNEELEIEIQNDIETSHIKMVEKRIAEIHAKSAKEINLISSENASIMKTLLKQREDYAELKGKVSEIETSNNEVKINNDQLIKNNQIVYKTSLYIIIGLSVLLISTSLLLYVIEIISYKIDFWKVGQLFNHANDNNRIAYYSFSTIPATIGIVLIKCIPKWLKSKLIMSFKNS